MRRALLSISLVACSAAAAPPPQGLEIEAVTGLGLFADERAKSQALISQAVSSRDGGVLPFEVTEKAWALAAQGRNPITGAECGRSLPAYQARKRWGAQLGLTGTVSSDVWCGNDGGCELKVNGRPLDDLDDEETERFRWVASISPTGDALGALAAAVAKLAPPPPDAKGGLSSIFGSLGGSQPIQDEDRLELSIWPADHRDATKVNDDESGFPALTLAQAQTCLGADESSVLTLVEVSAEGTIGRCEGDPSETPAAASCLCGQLRKSAPAPWLAGKRWNVSVSVDRKDQTTSDRRLVISGSWNTYLDMRMLKGKQFPQFRAKVEDQSIEAWSPGPSRLATGCFTSAFTAPGALTSRWAVWFDGAGRPTKIIEQKAYPPLKKELAECVVRALRTAQAPCPSRAGLWAMANLNVNARDPNSKSSPLDGLLKK